MEGAIVRRAALLLLLAGCTEVTVVAPEGDAGSSAVDAGADVAPAVDAAPPELDAGLEAAGDAGPEACAPPAVKDDAIGSSSCTIQGACPTCADGLWYRCAGIEQRPRHATSGITWDPLPNSRPIGSPAPGVTDYCAPAACVRVTAQDGTCFPARPFAIVCPTKPDGLPAVAAPTTCSLETLTPGADSVRLCCGAE